MGKEEKIHIWRDRWVLCPSTYKIITPKKQLPQGQWVKNLLKKDSNEWDVPLVRQTFLSQDADAILSIPLSASGAQDRMVWSENKSGKFTIWSAYWLAQLDRGGEGRAECSNPTSVKRIWRGVWSMDLPNKVKHFAWKACRNILATKENLWKRKITRDGVCEGCKKEIESTGHLFWTCQKAKEVWSHSKLAFPFQVSPTWDFMDVMSHLLKWSEASPGLPERVVMVCWGMWKNRNEVRNGGQDRTGSAIVRSSLRLLDEF